MKPRTLFIDIETAPTLGYFWGLWKENIGINQIKKHSHLLSFGAKWLGEKKLIYQDQSKCKDIENDKNLVLAIRDLLDEAEIVVVQNGDAFDIPTIKTRMLAHGITPFSPFRSVDTLLVAKREFRFTSNKLEYMAEALGCKVKKGKHKEFPGFDLWKECMTGNNRAWAEMKLYNLDDVIVLEEVYMKMRPWMTNHPNMGIYVEGEKPVCPNCSGKVQHRGTKYTATGIFKQYHCLECGKYSRSRINDATIAHRKNQLSG